MVGNSLQIGLRIEMIQLRKIEYTIVDRVLLKEIDWAIDDGKKLALIGPNGAGKTTLFKIICNELKPSEGEIIKPKDFTIGYLPQEEIAIESGEILKKVMAGNSRLVEISRQIEKMHNHLDYEGKHDEKIIQQLSQKEDEFRLLGGYQLESQAKSLLSGLGFSEKDYTRNIFEFSGGWRMRVQLARLLIQKPDLLLLDEPTNHLDLPSLEWLEKFLTNYSGTVVSVSHDRYFIDRLSEEIYELEDGMLTRYIGNYHDYEQQKEKNRELLFKRWEEQKAERERQERFIERFRYKASKASQVQSRIKKLEKMERIDIAQHNYAIDFNIKVEMPSYKHVLKIRQLFFKYNENWVLENINLDIYRGEKVALVGVNGAGKTTLTRLIFEQLYPQAGILTIGERTKIGYYAQHQIDALNLENSVYDEVASITANSNLPKIRPVLGIFQFTGDDIYKKVKVLSGGEKARVSIAKILLSPVNFLIMDEPTNHLDIKSKEALERALADYDGTLLLISHDRYFLDKIVSRVIEISDGHLQEFWGNYSDYLHRREGDESEVEKEAKTDKEAAGNRKTKDQKRLEAEARQRISRVRNELKNEITRLEQELETLESRRLELESTMSSPETYKDGDLVAQVQKEYADIKADIEKKYAAWEERELRLEEILKQIS